MISNGNKNGYKVMSKISMCCVAEISAEVSKPTS